jgi:hypothetical protein
VISSGALRGLLRFTAARLVLYLVVIPVAASFGLRAVAAAHVGLMLVVCIALARWILPQLGVGPAGLVRAALYPALRAAACGVAAAATAYALDGLHPALVLPPAVAAGALTYAAILYISDSETFFEAASVVARGAGVIRRES